MNELHKSRVQLEKSRKTPDPLFMRSFFDTLIDQLKKDIPQAVLKPNSYTSTEEPDVIAQLIGRTSTVQTFKYETSAYRRFERPLPPHKLSSSQMVARESLVRMGAELSPRFPLQELKATFRKLALKHHPDHGGCALRFQELKASVEELKTLFNP